MNGKVKWFDTKKGYGFITPDDGGGDVFVHFGDFVQDLKTLEAGQSVQFEPSDTPRGRKASMVRLAQPPAS